ncbi:GNAT family N-acetyltransferase [Candidatus Woesearchaeota archaeon]|jgi:GNAT superfamily N-acetyltransferase|nr:GNAT family N-acetyltransferase [Candidatus Woesearchaeota archaeon]MBT4114024.1 GNAT family N-acetyltransferase [Candidatus Woesearchaeota archaeon]MBT4248369.1 GNAT family N-acetyltransferase [Candidatus Woesearchaeota archaeon]
MIIRKAKLSDSKELYRLYNLAVKGFKQDFGIIVHAETPITYIKKVIRKRKTLFLVAEDKGKLIGFAIAGRFEAADDKRERVFVDNVFVIKEYRKKGVASNFMKKILNWAKKNKCVRVGLSSHVKNKTALALWPKLGFKEHHISFKKDLK